VPHAAGTPNGHLRLGTFRSLWASKEVDASPALHFLRARQVAELSPEDAAALGIREGDRVEVGANGTRVRATVRLRAAIPSGSVFLAEGTEEDPANTLTDALVEVRRTGGPSGDGASAVPAQVAPAAEGLAEAPASAPMDIPPTAGGGTTTGGGREG
jgi:NADH-quinone oxidoreductase subunit G